VDMSGQLLVDESGLWTAYLTIADFQSKTARAEMELRRKKRSYRNVYGVFVDEIHWQARPLPSSTQRRTDP
jgi:hypothetical protein